MKSVEPIRDKKKIDAMKAILASGKYGQRNLVLFSIGINTAYRISDLRQLKLSDVLEISRGRVIVKERLAMKEQKTAKHNSVFISNKLRKVILDYVQSEFPEQLQAQDFSKYLFPSRKGADTPLTRQSLWRIIHEAGTVVGLERNWSPFDAQDLWLFFVQARNQNRDHSVAAQPFFTTGDLTLYWDHSGRQRYRSKEFGFMTE